MEWWTHGKGEPAAQPGRRWDTPPVVEPGQRAEIHAPRAAELMEPGAETAGDH